jgi:hypothetical protein
VDVEPVRRGGDRRGEEEAGESRQVEGQPGQHVTIA